MTMSLTSYYLFLNKPKGITSQQCLTRFKRKFDVKKIGHHGTLDPFASGLLLIGVGEATKFFQFVNDDRKTYEAVIKFGERTTTLDFTGDVVETRDVPVWTLEQIRTVLTSLVGRIAQTPPAYSAVKIGGEKSYALARRGIETTRSARQIEIYSLDILTWERPLLKIRTTVSRGTYVRVLAEQIAQQLDNVAHLTELTRTELCAMPLSRGFDAETADEIPEHGKISIASLLSTYAELHLDEEQFRHLICGRPVPLTEAQIHATPDKTPLSGFVSENFVGMVERENTVAKSIRLMSSTLHSKAPKLIE